MSGLAWKESRFLMCPLTDDEVQARGEALADGVRRLERLSAENKTAKEAMRRAEETIEGEIGKLARIVNDRQEQRSVEVELRANFTLRLVEEVRCDTGEIIQTRNVEERDKLRAQATLPLSEPDKTEKPIDEAAG